MNVNTEKFILLFIISVSSLLPVMGGRGEFYVWQREWTPEVQEAVSNALAAGRSLSVLAVEFNADGSISRPELPAGLLANEAVTAVFRVHAAEFRRHRPERLAQEAARLQPRRLELDIDVPESRLADYRDFLRELKRLLAAEPVRWSITALPAHLKHPEFREAAAEVDFYVLQLHGIRAPERLEQVYHLLDPAVAAAAIERARMLKISFKLALPSYGYALGFESESGRFAQLSPTSFLPAELIRRPALPDPAVLRELLAANGDLPYLWFRLPVPGDSLNYDLLAIEKLERSEALNPELEWEFRPVANNAAELWLTPRDFLALSIFIELKWPARRLETELPRYVRDRSEVISFGLAPERLEILFPGCGRKVRIATFFCQPEQYPEIIEVKP